MSVHETLPSLEQCEPTLAKNDYNTSKVKAKPELPKPADADAEIAAQQHPAPMDLVEEDISDIRAIAGVRIREKLPAQAREAWDQNYEAGFLTWAVQEGLQARVIEKPMLFYSDAVLFGDDLKDAAKMFDEEFATTLTKKQRDTLVKYVLTDIHGAE